MKRWAAIGLVLVLLAGGSPQLHVSAASSGAPQLAGVLDDRPPGATALYPSPNERFGFGILRNINNYDLAPLVAGWYQNWSHRANSPHPNSLMVAYMVRTPPEGLQLTTSALTIIAAEEPGALWLIGNEPDMIKQDNITPAEYARQYHDAYYAIKQVDPTAQVAAGGIVQPSPLRLGWLSAALDAYRQLFGHDMPVDVWNIHNYILPEKAGEWGADLPPGFTGARGQRYTLGDHDSLEIFQQQILAMRQWMADHGEQNKPLVISEYGILFPDYTGYDLQAVSTFFRNTADWMLTAADPELGFAADEDHLVQSWMWYSLDDVSFNNDGNTIAGLIHPETRKLTPMGQVFAGYVAPLRRPYVNLVASRATMRTLDGTPISSTKVQTVAVDATVRNLGNTPATRPFRVTIEDQLGNRLFDQMVNGMPARYGGNVTVTVNWQKPAGYEWHLVVRVDPDDSVSESNETDNTIPVRLTGDLRVQSLAVDGQTGTYQIVTDPGVGTMLLESKVENLSSFRVPNALVRIWDGAVLLHEQTIASLAANSVTSFDFTWVNPTVGQHLLMAEALTPPEVVDAITANNRQARGLLVAASRVNLPLVPLHPGTQSTGGTPSCSTSAVRNSSFESGDFTGWQRSTYVALMESGCYQGKYCAYLGRVLGMEETLSQTITIPADSSAHLSYGWAIVTLEPSPSGQDALRAELRSTGGELLKVLEQLDNRDAQPVWYGSSINLSEFAGREVVLQFRAQNDLGNPTFFYIDAVVLEACQRQ